MNSNERQTPWQQLLEWPRERAWTLKQRWGASRRPTLPQTRDIPHRIAMFSPEQRARYDYLAGNYDLTGLERYLSPEQWVEDLFVLDVLDRHVVTRPRNGAGLEIGCRNFSYLPALYAFAALSWHGVEVDAHARYWNGVTRAAHGRELASHYPDSVYHAASLTDLSHHYDLIVWFLPFLHLDTLLAYGLPRRYFSPRMLLAKAYDLLAPGGLLFIVNQGPVERDAQQRLCAELALSASTPEPIDSTFSPFRRRRFSTYLAKPPATASSL